MLETDILKALQTAALAAIATLTTVLPVKTIGITLTSLPDDGRYWEFVNIPNNRGNDYYDDSRVYQGNFRVILHWMTDEAGPYMATQLLDQFGALFKKGQAFSSGSAIVKIYDVPSASGVIESGAELLFPLTLPYRCFAV